MLSLRQWMRRKAGAAAPTVPQAAPPTDGSFDAQAFAKREPIRNNYRTIAASLSGLLPFQTVLDLGCGNGFLLEPLADHGKEVTGVELSPAAREMIRDDLRERVTTGDATSFDAGRRFDLVACVEVAEHIEPGLSDDLIGTIARHSANWVYFTAASPHQPGHGHINCHQQFYWLSRFRRHGIELDWDATEAFLASIEGLSPAKWLVENSLILRRLPPGEE